MAYRSLLIACTLAVSSLAGGSVTQADAAARATSNATIAAVASVDYRTVVTARPASSGAAPSATVVVAVYRRTTRSWTLALKRRLPETYFWKTVTAPRAICRLSIATAAPRNTGRAQVIVQLLRSPALGCGRAFKFRLPGR